MSSWRHVSSRISSVAFTIAFAGAITLACVCNACGSSSTNAAPDGGANDASSDGPSTNDTGPASNGTACDEHIRYVAHTAGLDSNDGCSPGYPKATIKATLDALRAASLAGYEVHVCAGNYDEAPVVVDFPVSVLGSYDCGTFVLPSDYGAPSFQGISSNILAPAAGASSFEITGNVVDTTSTIDGFQITGSDVGGSAAVHIGSGAAPALSNVVIVGGAGTLASVPAGAPPSAPGSIGVLVDTGASPLISDSQISGGSGTSTSASGLAGSVAIDLENPGEFLLTGLTIDGGTGQGSGVGSVGVIANATTTSGVCELSESTITGGTGTSDATASLGVSIADPRVKLNDAAIDGGAGTCATAGASCTVTAVSVSTSALSITNNRILAARAGNPIAPSSTGILVLGPSAAPATVAGGIILNMIEPAHGVTSGITLKNANDVSILANTIASTSAESASFGITIQNSSAVTIEGNLIAAVTGLYLAAPNTDPCPTFTKVDHNGFVVSGVIQHADAACAFPDAVTITDLAAYTNFSSNVRVAQTCTPDAQATCIAGCASQDACMLQVFAADPSPSNLFATGFAPATNMPCVFVKGGISASTIPQDMYGADRSADPTIGAAVSPQSCN